MFLFLFITKLKQLPVIGRLYCRFRYIGGQIKFDKKINSLTQHPRDCFPALKQGTVPKAGFVAQL